MQPNIHACAVHAIIVRLCTNTQSSGCGLNILKRTQRNISWILNELRGFQLNAHLSVYCVSLLNNWSSSLQSPFVRMNSCASLYLSKRKYTFTATARELSSASEILKRALFCHRVNVLFQFIVFTFNAEQATQFHDVQSLLTGMRSSTTRTTMCCEWRSLPSMTRARSPAWQRTVWASWRPPPLSQSEVQNSFVCVFILLVYSHEA